MMLSLNVHSNGIAICLVLALSAFGPDAIPCSTMTSIDASGNSPRFLLTPEEPPTIVIDMAILDAFGTVHSLQFEACSAHLHSKYYNPSTFSAIVGLCG
jgi:hypothetical protein